MEQYIPKSALVTEIERLKHKAKDLYGCSQFDTAYDNVLKSIDTLEVKEVDLDKEIELWYKKSVKNNRFDMNGFAKHFFELGLKVGGEEKQR